MGWEINFLEGLTSIGSANPNMNWLSWILLIITFSCDHGIIWIALIIILLCLKKTRRVGLCLGLGLLVFLLLINNVIVKNVVARARPFAENATLYENVKHWMLDNGQSLFGLFEVPDSYSFPSGHTASSFLAASVLICYNKKAGIGAYIYAFIIAFTRLYFGVHYPTDVIFGMLYGLITGFTSFYLFELVARKIKVKKKA